MVFRRTGSLLFALSVAFTVAASELNITPAVLMNGDYGVLFHRVISVTGGTPPYTALTVTDIDAYGTGIAAPAIDLAAGTVTFDSTPTNDGRVLFTVNAADSAGASTSRVYEVLINYELGFSPPFVVGEAVVGFGLGVYTEIANGTPPYTSLEVLDFDPGGTGAEAPVADLENGRIIGNGTVHGDGVATFRARATDSVGGVAEQDFSVTVDSALHFSPKTLPPGDVGSCYCHFLNSANGTSPCCEDVSVTNFDDGGTGLLPPDANAVAGTLTFTSTPTAPGTATVGVHITNTPGGPFDGSYDIVIHPAVAITPGTLPEGTSGDPYNQTITVSGGVPPYRSVTLRGYSRAITGLPNPTINRATGTITLAGTPASGGVLNFEITAYDSANGSAYQAYTLVIAFPLSSAPATLADGIAGQNYYQPIQVDGGTPPYTTFAVNAFNAGGTGLAAPALDASAGTIIFDNVPASAGTATFTIDVVDSFGRTLTKNYSIVIHPPIVITPESLPDGIVGNAYNQIITISGGIQPYDGFTVDFDAGGSGLPNPSFDVDGGTITLSGTPNATGTVSVSVKDNGALMRFYAFTIHPLSAPASMIASASTTTSILISWSASAGVSAYEVERSADGVNYSVVGGTASLTLTDTNASANTAYLYRVRAVSPAFSPYSTRDLATTVVFTDASLLSKPVKAIHFAQMRTAANAVRALAGQGALTFSESQLIKAMHITELRDALDAARSALGVPPLAYAHPTITPGVTKILAIDLEELRNGVK